MAWLQDNYGAIAVIFSFVAAVASVNYRAIKTEIYVKNMYKTIHGDGKNKGLLKELAEYNRQSQLITTKITARQNLHEALCAEEKNRMDSNLKRIFNELQELRKS